MGGCRHDAPARVARAIGAGTKSALRLHGKDAHARGVAAVSGRWQGLGLSLLHRNTQRQNGHDMNIQSIGIIGGLLMGQAAVSANICSSVVLIIVALSGIGMFTITDYSAKLAVSYFRVALILAGWLGGLLGLTVALFLSILWLANLKSYGVPFLSPVSPKTNSKGPAGLRGRIRSKTRLTDFANTRRASI